LAVNVSKTKKKTKEWKEGLLTLVRNNLDRCCRQVGIAHVSATTVPDLAPRISYCSFPSLYLFRYHNMRNEKFKELREALKGTSRQACVTLLPGRP
jgi:mRNA turnover protein 4